MDERPVGELPPDGVDGADQSWRRRLVVAGDHAQQQRCIQPILVRASRVAAFALGVAAGLDELADLLAHAPPVGHVAGQEPSWASSQARSSATAHIIFDCVK